MACRRVPTLAVWKFASCDGCQLSLLDCEDELLGLADRVEIAFFREATSRASRGPFDLSLADGSIATAADVERVREVRRVSKRLVAIGACATAGGIQGLRNFRDLPGFVSAVYARPDYIDALATSTPLAAHVPVDLELHGCPVSKRQLLDVVVAFLDGRRPVVDAHSVCVECKLRGNVCVMVTGTPCLGPVTHAGCGALCPTYLRGCYGCFGPMESPNTASLAAGFRAHGVPEGDLLRVFRTFNANAPPFRDASQAAERREQEGEAGPVEPRLHKLARVGHDGGGDGGDGG
jgi:coenzyme F420-reducing hydrogenase gamma subunit